MSGNSRDSSTLFAYRHLIAFLAGVLVALTLLPGCSNYSKEDSEEAYPLAEEVDEDNESSAADNSADTVPGSDAVGENLTKLKDAIDSEIDDRRNGHPSHYGIGEEVIATSNLAVSVDSVEPGPFDYGDKGPTVQVSVTMRNLSDRVISVKASNWDADNSYGQRVDHKLILKNENGKIAYRSFAPTRVSPGASFKGTLFFDGESLESIIYEPHWLVSGENQYIYFDIA